MCVEGFVVADLDIRDVALCIAHRGVDGIDEAFVGREFQTLVTREDLTMDGGIDLHTVGFDETTGGFVVALALDALHFGQERTEEVAHLGIVVDANEGLTLLFHEFHAGFRGFALFGLLKYPMGDEGTVAHVSFFDVVAGLDAYELRECTVLDVGVVGRLVSIGIRCESEFGELGISQIVEGKEVGAAFLDGGAVGLERIGVGAGQELSAAVTETLVEVSVEVVATIAVLQNELTRGLVDDELLVHTAAVSGFGVGVGKVGDGDGLRTEITTNPVGVGQVDADGGGGIEVAGENGGGDDFGGHALHFLLFETRIDGAVVFEPLGVEGEGVGTLCGGYVFEVDDAFPGGFHAEGIAVALDEAVDEIDVALHVFEPLDGIVVEGAEIAGAIELDEATNDGRLVGIFGKGDGGFEVLDDLRDGRAVESAFAPHVFFEKAELTAHETRVHAHHDGAGIGGGFALSIELFGFGLRDIGAVVVAGASEHEVFAVFLVGAHLHHIGIEDDGIEGFVERVVERTERGAQPLLGKSGYELLVAVMVVQTGGEPKALEVGDEGLEVLGLAVAAIVAIDSFEHVAEAKIVSTVLIVENVTTGECGFGEVVDERLLTKREAVEAFDFVAQHLNVGKLLVGVGEIIAGCRSGLCRGAQTESREGNEHGED